MSEELFSLEDENDDHSEAQLSDEDRAVLAAFDALNTLALNDETVPSLSQPQEEEFSDTHMLYLFAAEMDEDITQMKRALSQLEQRNTPDTLNMKSFDTLSRIAHKVRGTAGAMECHAMATIARYIEDIVKKIQSNTLPPLLGLNALVQAVLALEVTLENLLTTGEEASVPLTELEREIEQLPTFITPLETNSLDGMASSAQTDETNANAANEEKQCEQEMQALPLLPASIRVDAQRFEELLIHAEHSAEIRTPLEDAQEQVKLALNELHAAQLRLQQLESSLLTLSMPIRPSRQEKNLPASSLVERALKNATFSQGTSLVKKLKLRSQALKYNQETTWDELELERFSERDAIVRALNAAIADVTLAATRTQSAYARLQQITQQFIQQTTLVHDSLHQLRLTPLRVLLPRIQSVLDKSELSLSFNIAGDMIEIDQDILDGLSSPLLRLLRTCLNSVSFEEAASEPYSIWLHASAMGNEVTLELGFSMTIQGGALDAAQASMQQLGASVESHRNSESGVSFFVRFPRSQGTVRGLLVRVGQEQVILPFSQVHHVGDAEHEKLDIVYRLYKLLDFSPDAESQSGIKPVVVLPQGRSRLVAGILVDEIISDVEVVVKPLSKGLPRPGIAGTTLNGKGNLLLLLDIPELLKYYTTVRRHQIPDVDEEPREQKTQHLVLIADDSTLLRKSLEQTLTRADYKTVEASDGLEALDKLTQNPPDIFLLDMEMPNLNGYDLLSIMSVYPELMNVKVIMLTSRTTEKHKQHALDLGAHAFLTKPCPPDVLLETIAGLL